MSTRANIIISQTFGNSKKSKTIYIILYSHYDGYPSGVGSDLKNKLLKLARCKNNFGLNDVKDYIQRGNGFTYEVTNSVHGDIEYLYLINIDNKNKEFKLTCYNNGFYDKVEKDIAENGCNERFEIFSVTINYSYNQWVLTKIKPDTLNEYKCLKEKIERLKNLIDNPDLNDIVGPVQSKLLKEQYNAMVYYLTILGDRLIDFCVDY